MKSEQEIEEKIKAINKKLENPGLGDHFKTSWEGQLYILRWVITNE